MGKLRVTKMVIDNGSVIRYNGNNVGDVGRPGQEKDGPTVRSQQIIRWRKRKFYYDYRRKE